MEKLTKAEEEIIRIIWQIEPCTVGDIRAFIAKEQAGQKPPHSTISSLVANIKEKGYLTHKTYGRTFVYSSKVSQAQYSHKSLRKLVNNFFDGSMNSLVSFLVKKEELSKKELEALLHRLDEAQKEEE